MGRHLRAAVRPFDRGLLWWIQIAIDLRSALPDRCFEAAKLPFDSLAEVFSAGGAVNNLPRPPVRPAKPPRLTGLLDRG